MEGGGGDAATLQRSSPLGYALVMNQSVEQLLVRARELSRTGPLDEAIAAYERLLEAAPELANSWYNLGRLRAHAGRHEAALAAYGEALTRGAEAPEQIFLNRALIFSDGLSRFELAEAELISALQVNSEYLPALINLGNLVEDRGDREQARRYYTRALSLRPWFFEALARYANLHEPRGVNDPVIDRLRRALAMPNADPLERASLGFALARLLDAVGEYGEAFACARAANAASRQALRQGGFDVSYDRAAQEACIAALIAFFTPARLAQLRSELKIGTSASPQPIFICGMFRSGSTLCEQVLASHPAVTMGGELGLLPDLIARLLPDYPQALDSAGLGTLARAYQDGLAAAFPQAGQVSDKRTENFLHIGLIKLLFPEARIIHTERDPLDIALSIFFLHVDHRVPYAHDLADIVHYYTQYRRLMAHWQELFGSELYGFDYAKFVTAQRTATEDLLAYCGLPWDEACMDFHAAASVVRTASVWQVRKPLYRSSLGRAQHYEEQLAPLRPLLTRTA